MNRLDLDELVLQVLVILAILVGHGAYLFRRLGGQLAVGRAIGQHDLLSGIDADLALQQDQVFVQRVLCCDHGLLLRLQLHLGTQFVKIGGGSGLVRGMCLIEEHAVRLFQGVGVVHFAGCGNHVQIGGCHLLHDLAARRHLGKISRAFRCPGCFPARNDGAREQNLVIANLSLGQIVPGDLRESCGSDSAGKQGFELADDCWGRSRAPPGCAGRRRFPH